MKSKRTKRFRQLLRDLPIDVKRQAYAAYRLFKRDPYHTSLYFKPVRSKHPFYSVRIGIGHRALGLRETDDVIIWVWIGTHAEYDKILAHL
jgi:hypothetical protein